MSDSLPKDYSSDLWVPLNSKILWHSSSVEFFSYSEIHFPYAISINCNNAFNFFVWWKRKKTSYPFPFCYVLLIQGIPRAHVIVLDMIAHPLIGSGFLFRSLCTCPSVCVWSPSCPSILEWLLIHSVMWFRIDYHLGWGCPLSAGPQSPISPSSFLLLTLAGLLCQILPSGTVWLYLFTSLTFHPFSNLTWKHILSLLPLPLHFTLSKLVYHSSL